MARVTKDDVLYSMIGILAVRMNTIVFVGDIYLYEICLSSIEKEGRSKRFIFILFFPH
jgi:hypothetical protein